jgi:hypothetical protein
MRKKLLKPEKYSKKSIQFTDGCPPEFLMPVELTQMLIEYCPVVLLVSFAYDSHPFLLIFTVSACISRVINSNGQNIPFLLVRFVM